MKRAAQKRRPYSKERLKQLEAAAQLLEDLAGDVADDEERQRYLAMAKELRSAARRRPAKS